MISGALILMVLLQLSPQTDPRVNAALDDQSTYQRMVNLRPLAEEGVPGAAVLLEGYEAFFAFHPGNPQGACAVWEAGSRNVPQAAHLAAECRATGVVGEPDAVRAEALYRLGVAGGYPPSYCALGRLLVHIDESNRAEAVELCAAGSDLGDRDGQAFTAQHLLENGTTDADRARALDLLERAAGQGQPDAAYVLAGLLWAGEDVPQDVSRAADLWLIAHNGGRKEAALNLGDFNLRNAHASEGAERARSLEIAERWYLLATNVISDERREAARTRLEQVRALRAADGT